MYVHLGHIEHFPDIILANSSRWPVARHQQVNSGYSDYILNALVSTRKCGGVSAKVERCNELQKRGNLNWNRTDVDALASCRLHSAWHTTESSLVSTSSLGRDPPLANRRHRSSVPILEKTHFSRALYSAVQQQKYTHSQLLNVLIRAHCPPSSLAYIRTFFLLPLQEQP